MAAIPDGGEHALVLVSSDQICCKKFVGYISIAPIGGRCYFMKFTD